MQGAATPEFTVLPRGQPSHTLNRLNVLVGQGIPRPGASKVSGMMEVIAPEDGFILETCLPLTRHNSLGRTDAMKEQKNKHNGRLHVFRPEEEVVIEPVQTVPRMGCGNEPTSRPYTPSKQILLCTAKSLEKRNPLVARIVKKKSPKVKVRPHDCLEESDEKMKNSKIDEKTVNNEVCTEPQKDSVDKKNDEKPPDSSDDENNTGQTGNETQKRIAPLQLMGEFLKAIMERKFILAKKLCQMILIYEPSNPEAKQFLPLIEKKLLLESQSAGKEDEETEEESSDETEEETNSSEGSETETETSSEDSQDS
ncbi:glutamate-rich protein 2 isoform X1 [Thamnophis elegans]|uniref:glutamate-rich protein 2 isoform X1 n=2 Tax=Thamnophis elegans TaxID=35005 RepID=UPI001378410D|nr:glutamate-rich protein 2 isoform X1 [Thamnophis elegans]